MSTTFNSNPYGTMVMFQNKLEYVRGLTVDNRTDLLEVKKGKSKGEVIISPKPDKNKLDVTVHNSYVTKTNKEINDLKKEIEEIKKMLEPEIEETEPKK